jgi:anti-sigma regulatory factor (Ser/Thr protein kinase)
MGQLRSAIRAYARLDLAPADVLELCDGAVRDLGEDQIVTCIYAVFDPVENSLSYANAGHLPPVLASGDGPARRLASGGSAPLGSGPLTVTGQTLDLPPGSTLALYTDGLVERRDRDIDVGVDLLAQELATATADLAAGPAVLVSRLLPEGPDDDVALLLARVREGDRQIESAVFEVEAELNQVAASRAFVTRVLAEWGVAGATAADAVLLTGELVTNALTHGQGTVQVRLRHTRDALMLEVSDQAPFLPRRLRSGLEDEHGRGLLLVTRLSERWGVRPTPTGKSVWCVLALGPG